MASKKISVCLLLSLLLSLSSTPIMAKGRCNGSLLDISVGSYINTEIVFNSVSYTSGYLSTQCDTDSSPPQWNGSGTVTSDNHFMLYAHEDGGKTTGTINLTVKGPNGTQDMTFEFDYENSVTGCNIQQAKVTTSGSTYKYYCGYSSGVVGNCSEASGMWFSIEQLNAPSSC